MRRRRDSRGFTLIELLLVVIIISTLALMVVPRFAGRSEQARVATAEADIQANLAIALDLYEMDNGRYPTSEQGLDALKAAPSSPPTPTKWNGPYLKKGSLKDPWGNPYQYRSPGERNTDYDLYSYGPDATEGGGDDIANWETAETEQEEVF
ncbi:MAG: type II secretion system major pseudopilin GspG [Elusimicrobiota bacterium]